MGRMHKGRKYVEKQGNRWLRLSSIFENVETRKECTVTT
jgi:hypothetical protein